MTPKEKAEDIVVKMLEAIPDYIIQDNDTAAGISKVHAVIAVDEIIDSCSVDPLESIDVVAAALEASLYWKSVKEELNKL